MSLEYLEYLLFIINNHLLTFAPTESKMGSTLFNVDYSLQKKICLLCNMDTSELSLQTAGVIHNSSNIDRELFCKVFDIPHPSANAINYGNHELFQRWDPFCQFCSGNVLELCNLERQRLVLKAKIDQLQLKIANCVVNSFATTSCHHTGYLIKRQIYENWFERCHQITSTNIWESTSLPLASQKVAPINNTDEPKSTNEFNVRLVPVEQIINDPEAKDGYNSDNYSTVGNSPPSPCLEDNDNSDSEAIEVVFEPNVPVLPLPCVIKRVKKTKSHNSKKKTKTRTSKRKKEKKKKSLVEMQKNSLNENTGDQKESIQTDEQSSKDITTQKVEYESSQLSEKSGGLLPEQRKLTILESQLNKTDQAQSSVPVKQESQEKKKSTRKTVKVKKKTGPKKMDPNRFICTFCGKKFTQKCNFNVHVRSHTGEKPHKCSICGKGFNHQGNVKLHEATHDNTRFQGEPKFCCHLCGKKFHLKDTLSYHKWKKHSPTTPNSLSKVNCDLCNVIVSSAWDLKKHKQRMHTVHTKRPFKCSTCQLTFTDEMYEQMHQMTHNSELVLAYKCKTCSRGFKERYRINDHIRKVHKIDDPASNTIVAPLDTCVPLIRNKKGSKKEKIRKEKSIVKVKKGRKLKDPGRLTCKICGKVSKQLWDHNVHVRSHSGEKPHKCKYCDRKFNDLGNKKKHEDTHNEKRFEGEPKHLCHDCGKMFYLPGTLYHHRRKKHSEVLPKCYDKAECKICGAILYSIKSLKEHTKRRHNPNSNVIRPYQCLECKMTFKSSVSLKFHTVGHKNKDAIDDDLYKCTHCRPTTTEMFSKMNLHRHYESSHKEISVENIVLHKIYQCPHCPLNSNMRYRVVEHMSVVHDKITIRPSRKRSRKTQRNSKAKEKYISSESESEFETSLVEKKDLKSSNSKQKSYKSNVSKSYTLRKSSRVHGSTTGANAKLGSGNNLKELKRKLLQPSKCKELRIILERLDLPPIQKLETLDDMIEIKEEII